MADDRDTENQILKDIDKAAAAGINVPEPQQEIIDQSKYETSGLGAESNPS